MFEAKVYEDIRDEMLSGVADDVDTREGSIIYDALAKTALPMGEMYSDLAVFLGLVFADTADGFYLTRRAAELGVYRKLATKAIRKGIFKDTDGLPLDITIGSRFSFENITFIVMEKIVTGEYKLQAEQAGVIGNEGNGTILPIEPVENLGTAEITDIITPGTDDESDSSLYSRYLIRTQKQATSGNVYHYEQWALSVNGVGGVKVVPTWNGPGTVKVILLATDKTPATPSVVENVETYIEQERPIGATVTVVAATSLVINVTATITLAEGSTIVEAESQFKNALESYLETKAFTDDDDLIRYTQVANLLLDVPPIIDYGNLLVNGGTANIQPNDDAVAILGDVTFVE